MIHPNYPALGATPVASDPFPHVVVRNFLPPAALCAVRADLPAVGMRGSIPLDAVTLGPDARSLMTALEGDTLRRAIAGKFGLDLECAPTMVTMRVWTNERD